MGETPLRKKLSRREFVASAARLALLGALGALGLRLARGGFRRSPGRPASRSGETCVNEGLCRGCTVYSGCGLPSALSAKQARSRGRS